MLTFVWSLNRVYEIIDPFKEKIYIRNNIENKFMTLLMRSQNLAVICGRTYNYMRSFCRLKFLEYLNRWSVSDLLKAKNDWLLTMNDIKEEPQLCDIVMNENLDKYNMNPLSDYIVMKKLMIKNETELITESREYDWNTIDNYKKICDVVVGNDMRIYSNFNAKYLNCSAQQIMDIIKHAFCVHASQELIRSLIVRKLRKIVSDMTLVWEYDCTLNIHYDIPKVIEVINWRNKKYFYAHQSFLDMTNKYQSLFIFVDYSDLPKVMYRDGKKIYPSPSYTEIVNDSLDDTTTEALKEMTLIFQIKINFSKDNDCQLLHDSDDTNLLMIRNLIGDDNAFCYASKSDKIMIYCLNDRATIKCKYAATIDDFSFAVFVFNFNQTSYALSPQNSSVKNKTGIGPLFPKILVKRNFVLLSWIITKSLLQSLPRLHYR